MLGQLRHHQTKGAENSRVWANTTAPHLDSTIKMKKDDQIPPKGDARYRTHRSVKCYIAELGCGTKWCTWDFSESIERVVYLFPGNVEKVVYKNRFYELKPAHEMQSIIINHLNDKGAVNIAGIHLASYEKDKSFEPYPFG